MIVPDVVMAVAVVAGTVAVGVAAHELSHALALWLAGVPCRVDFLPARHGSGRFGAGAGDPLASVTPVRVPDDLSPWHLRAAALMPLGLALPFGLALAGVVPDPLAVGDPALELATVAWLGCSIPSPRDFSLVWYPERALDHAGPALADG